MPVYAFRLEAQDGSGHFRRGRIAADSEDEARETLEGREYEYALTALTTDEIAELVIGYGLGVEEALELPPEGKISEVTDEQGRPLPPVVRAKLATHRQADPYKLVELEEVG